MRLVQHRLIQHLTSRGAYKLHLQLVLVQDGDARVAEVIRVRKGVVRLLIADRAQALDVAGTAGNDVHRSGWVLEAIGVGGAVVDGHEALRVVHMAEDGEVDAVLVQQRLEGGLARSATTPAGRVPGPVAADNNPGRDGAVDGRQVRGQERQLLVRGAAEGPAVQARGPAGPVRRRREVCLRIDHHDVRHAVLEGVPEGRVCEDCGGVGRRFDGCVVGARRECGWHEIREAVHEICKILLFTTLESIMSTYGQSYLVFRELAGVSGAKNAR
ncbi:hypothetical protein F5Y10DRAFT_211338 [Nemania abortiva]|nr:hypothetical protein F5Y10DRAFT_211338 [Nemania abortiva]